MVSHSHIPRQPLESLSKHEHSSDLNHLLEEQHQYQQHVYSKDTATDELSHSSLMIKAMIALLGIHLFFVTERLTILLQNYRSRKRIKKRHSSVTKVAQIYPHSPTSSLRAEKGFGRTIEEGIDHLHQNHAGIPSTTTTTFTDIGSKSGPSLEQPRPNHTAGGTGNEFQHHHLMLHHRHGHHLHHLHHHHVHHHHLLLHTRKSDTEQAIPVQSHLPGQLSALPLAPLPEPPSRIGESEKDEKITTSQDLGLMAVQEMGDKRELNKDNNLVNRP
ncbi:unnamed protein product, partial [Protopolystoma xenopodis]